LGSFMVLRRMALVGDAMSHVALPGIAIALALNVNPFVSAFLFLFLAAFAIWAIEEKTGLPTEAIVGVFFTLSLAVGVLLTPELELLEALFGDISDISAADAIGAVILSVLVLAAAYRMRRSFLLGIISRDLAEASGVRVKRTNLVFLVLVAVVVALGVKAVIAKAFARIHRSNLVNFGIVPFTFVHEGDYEKIAQGDKLTIAVGSLENDDIVVRNETRGVDVPVKHKLSDREKDQIRAGGALGLAKQAK